MTIKTDNAREVTEKVTLNESARKRADYAINTDRYAALLESNDGSINGAYRAIAMLPNLRDIEAIVRSIGYKYNVDKSALWGDVLDAVAKDMLVKPHGPKCPRKGKEGHRCLTDSDIKRYRIGKHFPSNPRHVTSKFVRKARLIASTGKFRTERIKSRKRLPIDGMERQETSPNWAFYIGENNESMPPINADNVRYVDGHKSRGIPERDAFKPGGYVEKYFTELGLYRLYDVVVSNVNWQRNRGYYSINWAQVGADYAGLDKRKDHRSIARIRDIFGDLLLEAQEAYGHGESTLVCQKTGRTMTINKRNGEPVTLTNKGRNQATLTLEIGRSVATSDWKVRPTRYADKVDHYRKHKATYAREFPALVVYGNCNVCREVHEEIKRQITTSKTLANLHN